VPFHPPTMSKGSRKYEKLDSTLEEGDNGLEMSQVTFSIDDDDDNGLTSQQASQGPFNALPSSPLPPPMKHPILTLVGFFLMGALTAATIILPAFLSPLTNPPYVTYSSEEFFVKWLPHWSSLPEYLSVSR
jgi:hypothetical protein